MGLSNTTLDLWSYTFVTKCTLHKFHVRQHAGVSRNFVKFANVLRGQMSNELLRPAIFLARAKKN
jgi:hypothetical protein